MTPAQDATALADKIENWSPDSRQPLTLIARERRQIVAALRATSSQTPDAVRIASDFWMTISPDKEILRANVRAIGQNIADAITNALRPTPSASAGPQAGEVAWLIEWPEDNNMPVRWWNPSTGWMRDANKALWFVRESDAADYIAGVGKWVACVKPTEHKFLSHAHPQPQQADGRGAVIEALERIVVSFQGQADRYAKNCDDPKFDECQKEIWASLANEKLDDLRVLRKALQQSPATTDGAAK